MKNYYDLLGLQPTASQDEIKQAFRKLSLKFHPDKNDGDGFLMEMFKSINEANEILSNPEKRRNYDRMREDSLENGHGNTSTTATTSATSTSVNINDYERLHDLWKLYSEKKSKADEAYSYVIRASNLDEPHFVTAKKVLSCLLALLLIWFVLKPAANSTAIDSGQSAYQWVSTENTYIYKKPNVKSQVLDEVLFGSSLRAIDETNYFIKVEFMDNAGNIGKGYVKKSSLRRE